VHAQPCDSAVASMPFAVWCCSLDYVCAVTFVCSASSLPAVSAAHCEAVLAILSAPQASWQLRPLAMPGSGIETPLLSLLETMLPAPPGGWHQPALRAVAALLDAALSQLPATDDPAWELQASSQETAVLEAHCMRWHPCWPPSLMHLSRRRCWLSRWRTAALANSRCSW
jgi:hypothetical protein